jgi:hypothetical protein
MVRRGQAWLVLVVGLGAGENCSGHAVCPANTGSSARQRRDCAASRGTGSELSTLTGRQQLKLSHGPLRLKANRLEAVAPGRDAGEGGKTEARLTETAPPAPVVAPGAIVAVKPPHKVLDPHSVVSGNWALTRADVTGPAGDGVCHDRERACSPAGFRRVRS